MAIALERDPWGWVHPFYRKNHQQLLNELNEFFQSTSLTPLGKLGRFDLDSIINTNTPRIINKGDKFEMNLDVQQFAPEEIDVKLADNYLIVQGKHEEKQDEHGFVSRNFMRKYLLPSDVKPETITCDLSSDGVLHISAPKQIHNITSNEKVLPIKYTGLPAITDSKKERTVAAA